MLKKYLIVPLTFIISIVLILSCEDSEFNKLDEKLKSTDGFFSMVYNKEFSERFKLSSNEIEDLDEGLYAVAIEISKENHSYQCALHLYVNDNLDIYLPVEGDYYSDKTTAEFFFVNGYNNIDQLWNSSHINSNLMRILFRENSLDDSDEGIVSTLHYNRIHRSFLPGMSLLTIKPGCQIFEKENYPAQLWIQKKSVENYLLGNENPAKPMQRHNNQIFQIPDKLIDMVQPYIEITNKSLILE